MSNIQDAFDKKIIYKEHMERSLTILQLTRAQNVKRAQVN